MKGSRMLRRTLVLGALCVVVAAVGSVAWAMTSATNDKLVACARKSSGALRLVTAAKDCRKTERRGHLEPARPTWAPPGREGSRAKTGWMASTATTATTGWTAWTVTTATMVMMARQASPSGSTC